MKTWTTRVAGKLVICRKDHRRLSLVPVDIVVTRNDDDPTTIAIQKAVGEDSKEFGSHAVLLCDERVRPCSRQEQRLG